MSLKFCSMNYSSKVDEYNKQVHGIEKKDYSELVGRLVTISKLSLGQPSCKKRAG
jgi:cellobiose-specific phosphotransferase system component IIB